MYDEVNILLLSNSGPLEFLGVDPVLTSSLCVLYVHHLFDTVCYLFEITLPFLLSYLLSNHITRCVLSMFTSSLLVHHNHMFNICIQHVFAMGIPGVCYTHGSKALPLTPTICTQSTLLPWQVPMWPGINQQCTPLEVDCCSPTLSVLHLARVETNVDSKRRRTRDPWRAFFKGQGCWGLPQWLRATSGCLEFQGKGLQESAHSEVARRLRKIQMTRDNRVDSS